MVNEFYNIKCSVDQFHLCHWFGMTRPIFDGSFFFLSPGIWWWEIALERFGGLMSEQVKGGWDSNSIPGSII